jgi:hypothetical protein
LVWWVECRIFLSMMFASLKSQPSNYAKVCNDICQRGVLFSEMPISDWVKTSAAYMFLSGNLFCAPI